MLSLIVAVQIVACSDPSRKFITTISVETLIANKSKYDGRTFSANGSLIAKQLPNGDYQYYLVPDKSWTDLIFSVEELNILAIRISFPANTEASHPAACVGMFVSAQGDFSVIGRNAVLAMGDVGGMISRERNNRIDCRYVSVE